VGWDLDHFSISPEPVHELRKAGLSAADTNAEQMLSELPRLAGWKIHHNIHAEHSFFIELRYISFIFNS
jgi:hypothetical protein